VAAWGGVRRGWGWGALAGVALAAGGRGLAGSAALDLIRPDLILGDLIRPNLTRPNLIRSRLIQFDPNEFDPIRLDPAQSLRLDLTQRGNSASGKPDNQTL